MFHSRIITIQALDRMNTDIKFDVSIVILIIDYILYSFLRVCDCFDSKVV